MFSRKAEDVKSAWGEVRFPPLLTTTSAAAFGKAGSLVDVIRMNLALGEMWEKGRSPPSSHSTAHLTFHSHGFPYLNCFPFIPRFVTSSSETEFRSVRLGLFASGSQREVNQEKKARKRVTGSLTGTQLHLNSSPCGSATSALFHLSRGRGF